MGNAIVTSVVRYPSVVGAASRRLQYNMAAQMLSGVSAPIAGAADGRGECRSSLAHGVSLTAVVAVTISSAVVER